MHWRSRDPESREISPIPLPIAAAARAVAVVETQGLDNAVLLLSLLLIRRLHLFPTISRAKDTCPSIIPERLSRRCVRCECKDKSSMGVPGSPHKTRM